jgi:branched-chain amino acid transport system permease protein
VARAAWDSAWPILVGLALALAMWGTLPRTMGPYYTRIVLDMGIAMMLAVSLNIVNGMTGQFSMGHAGFMTLGGYSAGLITYYGSLAIWGDTLRHGGPFGAGEWMFAGSCLAGGLVAAAAGYVVGLPALRLRGDYLAIATLGFGEIVRVVLQQTNKTLDDWESVQHATWSELIPPPVGGALGFAGLPKYTNLFWVYAFLTLTVVAAYRLKLSSLGRGMISVREDEIAAQAMGVNITRQKVWAFVFAGFLGGTAGGLYAHESGLDLNPNDAGFQRSFDIIIMTVLGGKGSISGVMVAAGLLAMLPELLREFEQYRLIVYALLLIVMMIVRPGGLCGVHELWEFLPLRRKSASAEARR